MRGQSQFPQDRSDIQYAVKELSTAMSDPGSVDMAKMKRLARYLIRVPRCVVKYDYQSKVEALVAWSDSDFAGCLKSRKSTSGGIIMFGGCVIKSYSSQQAVRALSSGEAEYYAMVKAASVAIGVRSMLMDLGVTEGRIVLKTDASAALGVAQRLGIGKIRHIEVNQLWLQEKVYNGDIIVEKVGTDENLADALTKPLTSQGVLKHVEGLRYDMRQDRHRLAPSVGEKGEDGDGDENDDDDDDVDVDGDDYEESPGE